MTRLLLLARACLLGVMCAPAALTAAPPTGLMTDLIEHTDRVWIDGDSTQTTLEERRPVDRAGADGADLQPAPDVQLGAQ